MKHSIFHKSISISIALLVLFSTLSFTVEKHYCGSNLVDVAVFTNAKTCGMEMPSSSKETVKKSCCKDEVDLMKGQDELKLSFQNFDLDEQQFLAAFFYTYSNLFEDIVKRNISYKDYSPPDLVVDIQLLNQTFLI